MTTQHRRILNRGAMIAAVLALGAVGSATAAGAGNQTSLHGVFDETSDGAAAGYDIHGSAKLTISSKGTVAKVNVAGLDPGKAYGSHVHNGTCASGGGGHYQNAVPGLTRPPNELWLTTSGDVLEPNPGGVAHGAGSATWIARTSSGPTNVRSIVVHEPITGVRIACADLQ